MANDGQIVFEVTADGKHAIANIKEITKAIQQEAGKWDDAAKGATDGIENKFSGMLSKLAAGFSAVKIGKALLDLGSAAVDAASDLREVQNVVDVTFGSNTNQIETWAKSAGAQFGLTETQAKKFSSTMGAMLKSSGMAGDEIVQVSTDLAGLAADMASFYNLDFEEAFSKIRSGMSGMTMPLKELGIDMSVDTMNAYALAQGMEKTYSQMSQSEQTMLRYQYLMKATADAQGDFARTSKEYANSTRTLENNVERVKTILGNSFIDVVTNAKNTLNELLYLLFPEEKQTTVIDDFNAINVDTEAKLQEIAKIKEEAQATADILKEIYGKGEGEDEQGTAAAEVVAKYGVKSEETKAYLEDLGFSTDEINEKQNNWLETCKRLVKVLPGLNEIINTETGEVKGGTQAVYDYIKAWEEGQTKLVMLGALEQKEAALASRFSKLPELQLDAALAQKRARDQRKKLQDLYNKYGITGELRNFRTVADSAIQGAAKGNASEAIRMRVELNKEYSEMRRLEGEADDARRAYETQANALKEAQAAIEEYRQTIAEMPGDVQKAASESEKFWQDNKESITTIYNAAKEAVANLEDYVQGVHDAVEKSVNSVISGFNRIRKAGADLRDESEDLAEQETDVLSKYSDVFKEGQDPREILKDQESKWDTLTTREKEAHEALVKVYNAQEKVNESLKQFKPEGMIENLNSQITYMEEYLKNLGTLQSWGLSPELLSFLSDGSEESAEYLAGLVAGGKEAAQEVDKAYQQVNEKNKEFTDTLTQQSLAADDVYAQLAAKAKEAVAALDMEELAAENTGKTVKGAVQGIAKHIPEVADVVDSFLAELDRLNGYGVHIDFGGFGSIDFTTSTGETEGSGRFGLDYVPHDDYIARLHQGERVLTAQENQVWNTLLRGGRSGFDLDDLGGVMRDNVKPGGNVYLNGRVVGEVISDQQGKSFRQLQRSGWQS